MFFTLLMTVLALIVLYVARSVLRFRVNLAAAKASGIPYIIVPMFLADRLWLISGPLIVPYLRKLPESWTEPWLGLIVEWGWTRGYEPFARIGAETFLTVSPSRIMLNTAEASVINQITTRKADFPKALEVYESLRLYGTNVVTTEGADWRVHRKIVNPPFSEKNNHLVWQETLEQSDAMVNSWIGTGQTRSRTLRHIADDAMRLSLHIISRAGFGVRLSWPGMASEAKFEDDIEWASDHKMSYTDALGSLLHNIIPLIALPRYVVKYLPVKAMQKVQLSYVEWGKYMKEMFEQKKAQIETGEEGTEMDLMIAMLKGAGVTIVGKDGQPAEQILTQEEILGNAFVFILAGHETTANSIHMCLVYLAMNLEAQHKLQRDMEETFRGRPVKEWDYDTYISLLFGNMAGAVLNEELRIIPPVVGIPKKTFTPQPLTVAGKKCLVPENTFIQLMCPCAHRNPNQWPTGPPADPDHPLHPLSNRDNDLEEFKPERWFVPNDQEGSDNGHADSKKDDTAHTARNMFKPEKGAYIPFSEGHRSCIGRRFAQVELLAFLAFFFSQYSIELSVEEWASDAQVAEMDAGEKKAVWNKAREKIERSLRDDMGSIITLQLREGFFALRAVKKGHELFR